MDQLSIISSLAYESASVITFINKICKIFDFNKLITFQEGFYSMQGTKEYIDRKKKL